MPTLFRSKCRPLIIVSAKQQFRTMIRTNHRNIDRPLRYTDEEKLGMIQEYLTTDISQDAMSEKYGIGHSSIPRWMRIFGISMPNDASSQTMKTQDKAKDNRADRIAYAQLFEFCNYAYEPVTDIVELKGEKAEELIVSIQ